MKTSISAGRWNFPFGQHYRIMKLPTYFISSISEYRLLMKFKSFGFKGEFTILNQKQSLKYLLWMMNHLNILMKSMDCLFLGSIIICIFSLF